MHRKAGKLCSRLPIRPGCLRQFHCASSEASTFRIRPYIYVSLNHRLLLQLSCRGRPFELDSRNEFYVRI